MSDEKRKMPIVKAIPDKKLKTINFFNSRLSLFLEIVGKTACCNISYGIMQTSITFSEISKPLT